MTRGASIRLNMANCGFGPVIVAAMAGALATSSAAQAKSFDYVGWDSYLGGAESSQYSSLNQIDRTNVTKLQPAWSFQLADGPPPRLNPLVANGNMYLFSGPNTLVALDPATGKEKWRKAFTGRVGARGLNYWQSTDGKDKRLLFMNDGFLRAVNAENGEPIAAFGKDGQVDLRAGLSGDVSKLRPLMTDNPGRIYKNLLIMSLPAGAYDFTSSPADIQAFDIRTGKLVWKFHTVPEKGEFGYETWPAKDHEKFGGVHNWSESTVDDELGMVYIPTGTARYDFYGGNREGENLYANSVVALNAATGKRVWHFQTIHHDLWDYDIPTAPKLMTIQKDGKDVPILIQATKQGYVYVFDRRNGKPIWPIEEKPFPASDVPGEKAWPTQPIPSAPPPFARQSFTEADINPFIPEADKAKVRELLKTSRNEGLFTPPTLAGTISMPGHNGGANWGSSAVDPVNNRFYVVSKQLPTLDKLVLDNRPQALAEMPNGGGDVKPYKSPVNFLMQSNGLSAISPPWSTITAYDMKEGKILWQRPDGDIPALAALGIKDTGSHAPRGGPVVTAGGVMFVATSSDRKLRARNTDDGSVLWEYDLPAASEGVPAVYAVGGRQYVVIPVGGDGGFSLRMGQTKPGPNQYIAFALPQAAQN